MRAFEFIEKNMDAFHDFVRIGVIPTTFLSHYNIFCIYKSSANIKSQTNRIYFTADVAKVSPTTVRNALRAMNKHVSKFVKK